MTPYNLKVLTPEKVFFQGQTQQLIAKTTSGNVGILAGHMPYVASIVPSELKIKVEGEFKSAAISGGLIKVAADGNVTILSPAIEWSDEIDVARAQRSKERAEKALKVQASIEEFDLAQQRLRRALNRLAVSAKK